MVADGTKRCLVPVVIRAALASSLDVVALKSRPRAASGPRALPSVALGNAPDETPIIFLLRIERRRGGLGAQDLSAHEIEDLYVSPCPNVHI